MKLKGLRYPGLVLALVTGLCGCATSDVSADQKDYLARTYCLDNQPTDIFASREEGCAFYQAHFIRSSTGTPEGFFQYLQSTKNLCDLDPKNCLSYWQAVSEKSIMSKLYPGLDVRDPRISAAKRSTVKACMDDSHPVTLDGRDAKPDVCLQAARLVRGDHVSPAMQRKLEHRACDLGDTDECHYATMDGEDVDIKASEALETARQHQSGAQATAAGPAAPVPASPPPPTAPSDTP
nr:hypothetical protein [uncultured Lichenicoccus sp.]